jgi:hypothetical protein
MEALDTGTNGYINYKDKVTVRQEQEEACVQQVCLQLRLLREAGE